METALLSDMLYPSRIYFAAVTSQASQRWLNAELILKIPVKWSVSIQQQAKS